MPEFSSDEIVSLVIRAVRQGVSVGNVAAHLRETSNIEIERRQAWRIVERAIMNGQLRFVPRPEFAVAQELMEGFPEAGLRRIEVVPSVARDDVARAGAEMLCSILRENYCGQEEVHIGFAGGGTLRRVARFLSNMIEDSQTDLPRRLVFHAMVAGWNVDDPTTDPNSFFAYFSPDLQRLGLETRFVGLHAPGMVEAQHFNTVRGLQGVSDSFERKEKIDVVVTSAGRWQCAHSALYLLYRKYCPEVVDRLDQCVGDFMWQPLGRAGPITLDEIGAPVRTVTLMDLPELQQRVASGRSHVLLVLGPCSHCGEAKAEVLKPVLELATSKRRLITHLVCDSRVARKTLATMDT